MLTEITLDRMNAYRELFHGPQVRMVLNAILAGNTRAQLWVENEQPATFALLWDKGNNVFYLTGRPSSTADEARIAQFVDGVLRRLASEENLVWFSVHALFDSSAAAESQVQALFRNVNLARKRKAFYALPPTSLVKPPAVASQDIVFRPINAACLESARNASAGGATQPANLDRVIDEIEWMWPSLDRFRAHGFGTAAIHRNRATGRETIACWCTAEYVSADQCGIGIETAQAYQGQGLATATAVRFVTAARGRGITPHWECDTSNRASVRVAEKVGFARVAEVDVWRGTFPIV